MTARVGVVGWPVDQSRSPLMFAHWIALTGIDAFYERIPVTLEEGPAFFRSFPDDLLGVSVTMPLKGVAAGIVQAERVAARLGSVNTVWREDGVLRGTSTDGAGFLASLDEGAPHWSDVDGHVVVLGAGGASAAVAGALRDVGREVIILNRTHGKAVKLAETVGGTAILWERLPEVMEHAALLVNGTSLGMKGAAALDIDLAPLPDRAVVTDIVYSPIETPLIRAARGRGLTAVDGLGMLLHQGALQFELWFGERPPVDAALRAKALATL